MGSCPAPPSQQTQKVAEVVAAVEVEVARQS